MKIFLVFFLFTAVSEAQFIDWTSSRDAERFANTDFLAPNEYYPHENPAYTHYQKGLLVSVGTERSFIAASMSPQIEGLLVVDKNPSVARFVRINAELLRVSKDRTTYLSLRYAVDFSFWAKSGLDVLDYVWWSRHISQTDLVTSERDDGMEYLREGIERPHTYGPLTETYLSRDDLFVNVKKLADQNKIQGITLDLRDASETSRFFSELRKNKIKLSVFDLSNAHATMHLKKEHLIHLLDELTIFNLSAFLTVTSSVKDAKQSWRYYSWPVSFIARMGPESFYAGTFQKPAKVIRKSAVKCRSSLK